MSPLALILIGGGLFSVYAGVTGQPVLPALKSILSGKRPAPAGNGGGWPGGTAGGDLQGYQPPAGPEQGWGPTGGIPMQPPRRHAPVQAVPAPQLASPPTVWQNVPAAVPTQRTGRR